MALGNLWLGSPTPRLAVKPSEPAAGRMLIENLSQNEFIMSSQCPPPQKKNPVFRSILFQKVNEQRCMYTVAKKRETTHMPIIRGLSTYM